VSVEVQSAEVAMGLLKSRFGGSDKKPEPVSMRDVLFGDRPLEQWPPPGAASNAFPWSAFAAARAQLAAGNRAAAVASWREILAHPDLESRHYLQAWHFLRAQGEQPAADVAKQVLGVVVEVALPQGLDLLAAYADRNARYYNFSGAGVVWEHPNPSLDVLIDQLLAAAHVVVQQIGPWDKARPPAPAGDHVRLSFLTPSGLHFGQGPMGNFRKDRLAAPVLDLATRLMTDLIAKTKAR
jgi:hypothetical protein